MERNIKVVFTDSPPSENQLRAEHAVVVHSLYEAALVIAEQALGEGLKKLGVQDLIETPEGHRARVDEVYYELLTKKPVLASGLPEVHIRESFEQLNLQF